MLTDIFKRNSTVLPAIEL